MRMMLSGFVLFAIPSIVLAQKPTSIPDPDPELERKSFIVDPAFEVNLFASDPLLAKPIQMNWDAQGRLWVATSETYPQIKPGEPANDKIIILEDTNNDGRADKTTVFADGLLIPTGIEPGDGGAYVANSTELVHLAASRPGEKADRKRILLSGFGTEDTHHIIHTFRWGPDQSLYFNQSVYIHSHIETPYGVRRLNGGGIWRFRPDTQDLSVFLRGFWNPWGHAFDRYGQSFVTDGANGEGITHGLPGAAYPAAVGVSRILHGLNPGSPKHCGLEVLSGRHIPDDWQGHLITNDFRGHRVCRFKLSDDGSTFASREMPELIKTNHPAFRPVDVKMGPDGAIYIADWYNPIIQHGEVDFRDPRRDKVHGRIWRLTAKGRPLVPKPQLVDATIDQLLDHLRAPEQWTRQQARRVLKERGAQAVLPPLAEWVARLDASNPDHEQCRLEAAWVFASFGALRGSGVANLLQAADANVRAAAVRLLADHPEDLPDTLERLAERVLDRHPRVRLEAVLALRTQRKAQAAEAALRVLDQPMDRTLDYALWLTVRELQPFWMPEFQSGRLIFGGDAKKIAYVLAAVGNSEAIQPLLRIIESGKLGPAATDELWLQVARWGGSADIGKVLARLVASVEDRSPMPSAEAILKAVETSVRERKIPPPENAGAYLKLLAGQPSARPVVFRLAGRWKLAEFRPMVETILLERVVEGPADEILAAAESLALYADDPAKKTLSESASPASPIVVRQAAISALAPLDASLAARHAVDLLSTTDKPDSIDGVLMALLRQKTGVSALTSALKDRTISADAAKYALQVVRNSGLPAHPLVEALTKAGRLESQAKEPTPEEVKALAAAAVTQGDASRGERVFRRKELQCLACHAIGGAGGLVGPDLTSIGASAQPDYLVESLRIPNKAVKEGYHAIRVVTSDDKIILGIRVSETAQELVLRTPEDKLVTIPTADIDEKSPTRSLMPDGLVDSLTRAEFLDLVKFLSELGKVGPYAPSPARVVRRWQVIEPTKENLFLFRRTRSAAAAENDNPFTWSPIYSLVSGILPLTDLPAFSVWKDSGEQSIVRCQLDVTTPGAIKLRFNDISGLTLYLGPQPVSIQEETIIEVPAGVQTLTLLIDRGKRNADLRLELDDLSGSPARAMWVGGK